MENSFKKYILILTAIVGISVVGYLIYKNLYTNSKTSGNDTTTVSDSNADIDESDAAVDGDTEFESGYEDWDEKYLEYAKDNNVVLFFYAPWCPTCKVLNDNLNTSIDDVPNNLLLLKTNYDSEKELKKKYGVTYQHTLVQVDENGDMIKKWSNSYTLDDIVSEI